MSVRALEVKLKSFGLLSMNQTLLGTHFVAQNITVLTSTCYQEYLYQIISKIHFYNINNQRMKSMKQKHQKLAICKKTETVFDCNTDIEI